MVFFDDGEWPRALLGLRRTKPHAEKRYCPTRLFTIDFWVLRSIGVLNHHLQIQSPMFTIIEPNMQ